MLPALLPIWGIEGECSSAGVLAQGNELGEGPRGGRRALSKALLTARATTLVDRPHGFTRPTVGPL